MKVFHLSDLHIGRQLHLYSLIEVQKQVLNQIIEQIKIHQPDAVLICGDIYDKSVPSAEAYQLMDCFLKGLAELRPQIPILIISGNHDNISRLQYASSFMEDNRIYIAATPPQREGETIRKITLQDEYGPVNFYLLPFLKPGYVRHLFPEGAVTDYTSAICQVLALSHIDLTQRNVLLSHQFYVHGAQKPSTCDSEQAAISVGGLDQVETSVVADFDYVALGHLHGKQSVGAPHIRYCGTPYKYSVSEANQEKSITVVSLGEKNTAPHITELPLVTKPDVCTKRGLLAQILAEATADNQADYISVTITDEEEPYMPKQQLEAKYSHLLELKIDNSRTKALLEYVEETDTVLEPFAAFCQFYEAMQGCPMSEAETQMMERIIADAREREER